MAWFFLLASVLIVVLFFLGVRSIVKMIIDGWNAFMGKWDNK